MTKLKKKGKKNNMKKIVLAVFLINFTIYANANEINCKKFDIKCKASNFINETKNFQKKGVEDSKRQIIGTKDKVLKPLKK